MIEVKLKVKLYNCARLDWIHSHKLSMCSRQYDMRSIPSKKHSFKETAEVFLQRDSFKNIRTSISSVTIMINDYAPFASISPSPAWHLLGPPLPSTSFVHCFPVRVASMSVCCQYFLFDFSRRNALRWLGQYNSSLHCYSIILVIVGE